MEKTFSDDVNTPVFELLAKTAKNAETLIVFNTTPPQPTTTQVAVQNRRIFLQFNDPEDATRVDKIGEALASKSYAVQSKERVVQRTSGDVRFFYESDRTDASKIKEIVQRALVDQGVQRQIALLPLLGRYKNVPQGVFEVWLPSLSAH